MEWHQVIWYSNGRIPIRFKWPKIWFFVTLNTRKWNRKSVQVNLPVFEPYSILIGLFIHTTQLFLPSILIHLVSWIPFWFPSSIHSLLPRIRVLISFLSFLFLTWFCVTSESTRSPDAYEFNPKDIWVASVLVLTFVSFLHICILECGSEDGQGMARRGSEDTPFKPHFSENLVLGRRKVNTSKIACSIYPILFIAFNVAYWTYFLKDRD